MDYLLLIAAWGGWCAMHSMLISPSMTGYIKKRLPGSERWYRLFYNSFSLITLVLPVYCMTAIDSSQIFRWEGGMQIPRFGLLLLALVLFREGSKKYDIGFFLGIKQLQSGQSNTLLNGDGLFLPTGVFGIIRHPWYTGSLLLVWSALSVYTTATTITAAILSVYLVIGTLLEERKILAEYGESYIFYQKHVSMLFPWKWLVQRFNL